MPEAYSPSTPTSCPDGLQAHLPGAVLDSLYSHLVAAGFKGWEFDDALASPILGPLVSSSLLARRVAIQLVRRSVVNLRPLLRIPKLDSTKARGFIAKGLLCSYVASGDEKYAVEARTHLDWLLGHPSHGWPGISWGNHFDFASRGGFYPAGLPTVVWTAHVSEAFHIAHHVLGDERYRDAVVLAGDFVKSALGRHESGDAVCIGYAPGVLNLVHNSNLLAATTLVRSASLEHDAEKLELAKRSVRWTVDRVRPDGSLPYGEGSKYEWIDNFHTAYVIDSLHAIRSMTDSNMVSAEVIDRVYGYWTKTFFLADGTPRYYHDRTYPRDIQCCAQAIETATRMTPVYPSARELAFRVADWTMDSMRKKSGAFLYRRGRLSVNRLESIHWGQSTMLSALGYLRVLTDLGRDGVASLEPWVSADE